MKGARVFHVVCWPNKNLNYCSNINQRGLSVSKENFGGSSRKIECETKSISI